MLYYDRIDISEGIDVNKTSQSKEYDIQIQGLIFNCMFAMDAMIY